MAGETTTPNIGLQIAAFDQANWQVPTNYNWTLLDKILGGEVTVPALNVEVLTAGNIGDFALPPAMAETPVGAVPGTVYTLSQTPSPAAMLAFYVNGQFQRMGGLDATLTGNLVTLNVATSSGDKVYATYFYAA